MNSGEPPREPEGSVGRSAACVELGQLGAVGVDVAVEGQHTTLAAAQIHRVVRPADDHVITQKVHSGVDVTSVGILGPNFHQGIGAAANDLGAAAGLGAPAAIDAGLQLEPALGLELCFGGSFLGLAFGNDLGRGFGLALLGGLPFCLGFGLGFFAQADGQISSGLIAVGDVGLGALDAVAGVGVAFQLDATVNVGFVLCDHLFRGASNDADGVEADRGNSKGRGDGCVADGSFGKGGSALHGAMCVVWASQGRICQPAALGAAWSASAAYKCWSQ